MTCVLSRAWCLRPHFRCNSISKKFPPVGETETFSNYLRDLRILSWESNCFPDQNNTCTREGWVRRFWEVSDICSELGACSYELNTNDASSSHAEKLSPQLSVTCHLFDNFDFACFISNNIKHIIVINMSLSKQSDEATERMTISLLLSASASAAYPNSDH